MRLPLKILTQQRDLFEGTEISPYRPAGDGSRLLVCALCGRKVTYKYRHIHARVAHGIQKIGGTFK